MGTNRPFHLVIPAGTKVLTRVGGRVGVVARVLEGDDYLVRFAEGGVAAFGRAELTIFKHTNAEVPGRPGVAALLPFVIFRSVVGSTAYGLAQEGSDVDRRGIYLPPAVLQWGLAGLPEQLETDREECYWEMEKFVRLALQANPGALECLFSPLVETCTPLAEELVGMRRAFLSRFVHRTHSGYVLSQFQKLEQDLRTGRGIRWKHAMHLIRLLLTGVAILRDGDVVLRMDAYREPLLAIRRGEMDWGEVDRWRLALHLELDAALEGTGLPEVPDYAGANAFLLRARRVAAEAGYGGR